MKQQRQQHQYLLCQFIQLNILLTGDVHGLSTDFLQLTFLQFRRMDRDRTRGSRESGTPRFCTGGFAGLGPTVRLTKIRNLLYQKSIRNRYNFRKASTSDLVRCGVNGELSFCGRCDVLAKVGGQFYDSDRYSNSNSREKDSKPCFFKPSGAEKFVK